LTWIDWSITAFFLVGLMAVAFYTRKYTRSIADFLAASRCASRYMLAVSADATAFGAISVIAWFEMYYNGGFSAVWWGIIIMPIGIIIALSGWIIYRYRQTRAMTLAQFFEIRYSRRFRIFAGLLCFISGILNFGIFPSAGARFLIHFCNLPLSFNLYGFDIGTYPILLAVLLFMALYLTFGGQITVMVTDFFQGILFNVLFIAIIIFLLVSFKWETITAGLSMAPENASLINPFRSHGVKDFNISYFLMQAVGLVYAFMVWQGGQGFNCSAINPHEQKMGRALGSLRGLTHSLLFVLLPIIVYAVMHYPLFQGRSAEITRSLSRIDSDYLRTQMLVPVAAASLLKTGLLGSLVAVMIGGFIGVHSMYLHSWGSILIQDVILPISKKSLSPQQHLKWLKRSICGVAIFIFLWSLYFKQNESILMYFAITGSIYIGGAGAVLIGGLYWRRGTTTAAWCTMIMGSTLSILGITLRQIYPNFPLNSMWLSFITMLTSVVLYVVISLLGKQNKFNLDQMLHRGKYADQESEKIIVNASPGFLARLGITNDLNFKDKLVYLGCLGWTLSWFVVFVVGTIYAVFYEKFTDGQWLRFWYVWIFISLGASIVVTVWYGIGGYKDLLDLFRRLKARKIDEKDDGVVRADKQNNDTEVKTLIAEKARN
jgi:solute:Na+ symporter, SSS family